MKVFGRKRPADGGEQQATGKPTRRRARGKGGHRGVLGLIAASFLISALLRLGGENGRALAEEVAALTQDDTLATSAEPAGAQGDISATLQALQMREERLSAREAALADRAQALAVAEEQVRRHLAALAEAEADLERMVALSSEAAESDLDQLTSVYENMKPKQAAMVFAEMAPEFAAGFLARMRSDAAAAIMAGLEPEAAYAISVLLAGRNAQAPTK